MTRIRGCHHVLRRIALKRVVTYALSGMRRTMKATLFSWWGRNRSLVFRIIVIMPIMAIIASVYTGYWSHWPWTGFANKKLWDWLDLLAKLAIPVVVGLGAAWYNSQQGKTSSRESTDNQHQTILQAYIDKMSELLLDKKLRIAKEADSAEAYEEARKLARVRTLMVLRGTHAGARDPNRKASVLTVSSCMSLG